MNNNNNNKKNKIVDFYEKNIFKYSHASTISQWQYFHLIHSNVFVFHSKNKFVLQPFMFVALTKH